MINRRLYECQPMASTLTPPDSVPTAPRLALRPRECAQALGISEKTLFTATKAGEIPHVKLGKVVLYPVAQLREWLAECAARETGGDA
jgi:excisionase family DNA binding protein